MTNVSEQHNVAPETHTSTHSVPPPHERSGKVPSSVLGTMSKKDLSQRDFKGRTILHLLILTNKYDLLRRFFKNPDAKSILYLTDYESGWNCLHYCIYFKRLLCLRALMDYLKIFSPPGVPLAASNNTVYLELLRCKDRDRKTPLQLWDNDFKDLMQIPNLISPDGSYNFKARWPVHYKIYQKASIRSNPDWWHESRITDLIVLGSNHHYNLGIGHTQKTILTPMKVDPQPFHIPEKAARRTCNKAFAKNPIKEVKIRKYHSMVRATLNLWYSCGTGSKGRLGQHSKVDCYTFKKIPDVHQSRPFVFDTSNLHTVYLNYGLNGFGANDYHQLGIESDRGSDSKTEVIETEVQSIDCDEIEDGYIKGIAVSDVHTLIHNDEDIYFFGLCLGQLAFKKPQLKSSGSAEYRFRGKLLKGTLHLTPQKFTVVGRIKFVVTCPTATVIVTKVGDIQVHFQNRYVKMPRIPPSSSIEKHFDVFKPAMMTKAVEIKKVVMKNHDLVCFLLTTGDIKYIQLNESIHGPKLQIRYQNLWKAHNYDMMAVDVDISDDGSVILCTRSGSVFVRDVSGTFGGVPSQRKNSMSELTSSIKQAKSKFKKLEGLNKIVRLFCDNDFNSFAFLRDEVDIIPGTVGFSTVASDIGYLHCGIPFNFHRKQAEMLSEDEAYVDSGFTSKIFYPPYFGGVFNDDLVEDQGFFGRAKELFPDILDSSFMYKKSASNPFIAALKFELVSHDENHFKDIFSAASNSKHCDAKIHLSLYDIDIDTHSYILAVRSPLFHKKLHDAGDSKDSMVLFEKGDLKGSFNTTTRVFSIDGEISIKGLLIFLFFVYSDHELEIWSDYPMGDQCPPEIKKIRQSYLDLMSLFEINRLGNGGYLTEMLLLTESTSGLEDLIVNLDDGSVRCYSAILFARSAYFETLFSSRWEEEGSQLKEITLENVNVRSFKAVLRYLHGDVKNLFDELLDEGLMTLSNSDEFVNALLDLVVLSDEFLLLDLKNICQINISHFLTVDNVWLLLMHAEYLNAQTLFSNCCWLIYNNLDILVFDPTFKEIPLDLLAKVENRVSQFSKCRDVNFSDGSEETKQLYEKECIPLLTKFLNDIELFDQKFVRGFEPLVETRKEQMETKKTKRMLSVVNNQDMLQKLRSSLNDSSESLNFKSPTGLFSSSSAIEESEAAFAPVVGRRRRKSSRNTSIESIAVPVRSERIITPVGSQGDFLPTSSSPGVRTDYKWTSSGENSPKPQPNFGKDPQDAEKKQVKIKMVPRLSQKERRKASINQEGASSKPTPGPEHGIAYLWATSMSNSQSSVSSSGAASPSAGSTLSWATSTPILGGEKLKVPKSPILGASSSGPTLSEIMAQQSIRNDIQKDQNTQKKTLQEIQQEQEFAKWWEEEAARIQKSTTPVSQRQKPVNGKKGRKKKPSKLEAKS